ncbi:MAG TPA: glycosyltransferase [Solirubrobacterales bacterium]|nr:glycosyltransferase [Solirubrobacterales bacterium]
MPGDAGSDTQLPTISVVICAFTEERLEVLTEALDSLRGQTRPPREIVLVIDHAPQLLAEARRRWPDITAVPNRERQGLSGARNSGVAEATGEVVAFLDDDAIAAPDWLERLAAAYDDPEVLGAGGAVRPRWLEGRPRWFPPEFDWVVGCTHSGMPQRLEPVRNLVGANMSFRRQPLLEVGGFSHDLGRVGTLPVGCEETDLSIRVHQRWPEAEILYDPAAAVEHVVPPARGKVSYFLDRCRAEGRSKAVLSGMVGTGDGLSSERSYVRRTLPLGVLRDLGAPFKGDLSGPRRAAMILVGLAATTADYLRVRTGIAKPDETEGAHPSSNGTRPRVLMVTPRSPLEQGGVERHVLEVSRRMAAVGVHVEVLCTDPDSEGATDATHEGVRIRTLRAWPRGRDWHFAPGIWRAMGQKHWDVVHVQSYHTLVAPLAMLRALTLRIPFVVTFHGGGHSLEHRNRARGLQMRLLRPLLRRATRLVAIARFEVERYGMLLGVPAERFAFIPNGTDLSFADDDLVGGEPAVPTLASIGRLERYKGHQRVLEAFPLVLEQRPEARLLIVGKGPYEGELRRRVEELGLGESVEVTSVPAGDPRGMAALLGRVSLVVLMSEFETHPLVALEAAAARRRLLVADAGGLSEIAEGGFGRAIPPDSSCEQIAAAALEELGKPAPQSSPDNLTSWDECAAALLDLYGSLLKSEVPDADVTSSHRDAGRGQTSSARGPR